MVATLQTRKEVLEAKIADKTAELKALCLQEADLTGTLPPETPLLPGEPPPIIRKRVGTSFSFPQSLINKANSSENNIDNLEVECKVHADIAEAALRVANDLTATKAVRRKHRDLYRQSQRTLAELNTRLSLLQQGRHQSLKPQQIKKKPRPNTLDHTHLLREFQDQKLISNGTWPVKQDDDEFRQFGSIHSGTSQSSNSPRLSARDVPIGLPDQFSMTSSLSQPNIQELRKFDEISGKRPERRSFSRRQWDTQSAGGTLLPNQTYPDSHQPNLNRAHSMGSVDGQKQQEKEWYETSLDSAPSPPLRTSSRLPTSVRLQYHMKEMQIRDAVNRSLNSPRPHPTLTRAVRSTPVEEINNIMHAMHTPPASRHLFGETNESRLAENYTPPEYFESELSDTRRYASPVANRARANSTSERKMHYETQVVNRVTRTTYQPPPSRVLDTQGYTRTDAHNFTHKQYHAQYVSRMQDGEHVSSQSVTRTQENGQYGSHDFRSVIRTHENVFDTQSGMKAHENVSYDSQSGIRTHENVLYGTQSGNRTRENVYDGQSGIITHESVPYDTQSGNGTNENASYDNQSGIRTHEGAFDHQGGIKALDNVLYDSQSGIRTQENVHFDPQNVNRTQGNQATYGPHNDNYTQRQTPTQLNTQRIVQNNPDEQKNTQNSRIQYNPDNLTPTMPVSERPRYLNIPQQRVLSPSTDSVYIDIPDEVDSGARRAHDGSKTPTQPYFHGAGPQKTHHAPGMPVIHPPHAVTHDEITFDTVVPFESPQNHTVVQAGGVCQPYREVTKPFEMSDFYKYSTKFRQARQSPCTPEPGKNSRTDPGKVVGVYQPLRPMTCQPVERRPAPTPPHSP